MQISYIEFENQILYKSKIFKNGWKVLKYEMQYILFHTSAITSSIIRTAQIEKSLIHETAGDFIRKIFSTEIHKCQFPDKK